jgi:spore coat protein A
MGPGERNDVVVDFSGYEGETLLLHNDAPVPYRSQVGDGDEDTEPLPEVMLVDVGEEVCGSDPSCIPDSLGRVPEIPTDSLDRIRYLTLVRGRDEFDRPLHLLGDGDHRLGMRQTDPVEQEPAVGDTEVWSFANLSQVTHPMHIHLVQFQVLGRQSLGEFTPADETVDVESLDPPAAYEQGWTDTVAAPPGTVTHVAVHFGEYEGQFSRHTGRYMWHCHLLEHEDHDMMRPYRVVSADGTDGDGEADD